MLNAKAKTQQQKDIMIFCFKEYVQSLFLFLQFLSRYFHSIFFPYHHPVTFTVCSLDCMYGLAGQIPNMLATLCIRRIIFVLLFCTCSESKFMAEPALRLATSLTSR